MACTCVYRFPQKCVYGVAVQVEACLGAGSNLVKLAQDCERLCPAISHDIPDRVRVRNEPSPLPGLIQITPLVSRARTSALPSYKLRA